MSNKALTTKIDRKTLNAIRPRINAALEELGKELGITLTATNGKYSNGPTGQFKLEIAALGEDGEAFDQAKQDWKQYAAPLFDLPADGLGKTIRLGNGSFEITGLLPNRPKNSIQIRNTNTGKTMITTAETAKRALAKLA